MLKINNISKTFNPGTVNEKTALTGLNLHLDKGDFVTILGSNGAGKSTLFNAIAGTFVVDSGAIWLDGVNITNLPDYKRSKYIGRMFQDPLKGTAPNMTIEENLALGNRTIMMGAGKIVAQLEGEERSSMTAEDLLRLFHSQGLSNDRVLFSTTE